MGTQGVFSSKYRGFIPSCLLLCLSACHSGVGSLNLPAILAQSDTVRQDCKPVTLSAIQPEQLLLEALLEGLPSKLNQAVSAGADLNFHFSNQLTPLHVAAYGGQLSSIEFLLGKGATPQKKDCLGNTALHYAAASLNPQLVEKLLANGAQANAANQKGDTPLHFAAAIPPQLYADGHKQAKQNLLMSFFPLVERLKWQYRDTAKLQADKATTLNLLAAKLPDLDVANQDGRTPLFYAAMAKDSQAIRLLLQKGANLKTVDLAGKTLLHELAKGPLPIQFLLSSQPFLIGITEKLTVSKDPELLNLISELLQKGLSVRQPTHQGLYPLHFAARLGQTEILKMLLQSGADLKQSITPLNSVETPDSLSTEQSHEMRFLLRHYSPLHLAVLSGNRETLAFLLAQGADIESKVTDEPTQAQEVKAETALDVACQNKNLELVDYLLNNRALTDDSQRSALAIAIQNSDLPVLERLLKATPNLNWVNRKGDNLLSLAVKSEFDNGLKLLVEAGARVSGERNPVFPRAAERGNYLILDYLLKAEADPNAQDFSGRSALTFALTAGNAPLQAWLKSKGAQLETLSKAGHSSLFDLPVAPTFEKPFQSSLSLAEIQALKVNAEEWKGLNGHGATLFQHWLDSNRTDLALYALEQGADLQQQNKVGNTALHSAVQVRSQAAIEAILQKNPDLDQENALGQTPWHLAIETGQLEWVKRLAPAPTKKRLYQDYLSFVQAIEAKHQEVIRELLQQKWDLNYRLNRGLSLFHSLILAESPTWVPVFLLQGASPHLPAYHFNQFLSPLHLAVSKNSIETTELLLKSGADLNARSFGQNHSLLGSIGDTPLLFAVRSGQLQQVQLLVGQGAKPDEYNYLGKDAYTLACEGKQGAILQWLVSQLNPEQRRKISQKLLTYSEQPPSPDMRTLLENLLKP